MEVIDSSICSAGDTVVNPSVLSNPNSSQSHVVESTSLVTQSHRSRITLNDLKKLLQQDLNTSEVTVEQISRVKMMHDKFHEGTVFNFNYNTLLLVASVIAALGLVSDSTAAVIASMLGETLVLLLMDFVCLHILQWQMCDRSSS